MVDGTVAQFGNQGRSLQHPEVFRILDPQPLLRRNPVAY